jgi:hypothetical protein
LLALAQRNSVTGLCAAAAKLEELGEVSPRGVSMMFAIFAGVLIAFILDHVGWRGPALACLAASLGLCIYLFLWEIYSPDYGFRMPWLQVELKQVFVPTQGV